MSLHHLPPFSPENYVSALFRRFIENFFDDRLFLATRLCSVSPPPPPWLDKSWLKLFSSEALDYLFLTLTPPFPRDRLNPCVEL